MSAPSAASVRVVPISRFFSDHGPGLLERNPNPPCTLPQRFRADMAAVAAAVTNEMSLRSSPEPRAERPASTDGLRRALLLLSAAGESYSATSIAALSATMARAPLESAAERGAVQAFAALLQNRALTDQELATRVNQATLEWPGRRTTTPGQEPAAGPTFVERDAIVPIEGLLYSGPGALARAREVRNGLRAAWATRAPSPGDAAALALFDELSELLDLAVAG